MNSSCGATGTWRDYWNALLWRLEASLIATLKVLFLIAPWQFPYVYIVLLVPVLSGIS